MAKYIDAEKLKAEIESLHIDANKLCEKNRYINKDAHQYYGGKRDGYKVILSFIDSLQQEQTSLPSNLDEAAEKFARLYDNGTCDGIAQDCFKAGAEWMAEKAKQEHTEVDLEKVAEGVVLKFHPIMRECYAMNLGMYEMIELVKSGFELGFNARKEESK